MSGNRFSCFCSTGAPYYYVNVVLICYFKSIIKSTKKNNKQNAYFKTSISLTVKENQNVIFNGKIDGKISEKAKGRFGFGYDPVFIPKNYNKTLAELSANEKNEISHRSIAVTKLINFLIN